MMAGMSGLELQRKLDARKVEIPVIVLTGYGDVPTAVIANPRTGPSSSWRSRSTAKSCSSRLAKRSNWTTRGTASRKRARRCGRARSTHAPRKPNSQARRRRAVQQGNRHPAQRQLQNLRGPPRKIMRKMEANGVAGLVKMVVTSTDIGGQTVTEP